MARKRQTIEERFWPKVKKTETCWLWTGAMDRKTGYGLFSVRLQNGSTHSRSAHSIALELYLKRPLRKGFWSLHKCSVKLCVRHVYEGTPKQNWEDMMRDKPWLRWRKRKSKPI